MIALVLDHLVETGAWTAILYVMAAVMAGYPVARAARVSLQVRRADMNVLMTIAAVGAFILGDFGEASSLMILFAIGLALQSATIDRTRGAIRSLIDLAPSTARIKVGDHEQSIPIAQVKSGDMILVRPGERVPVDGSIQFGTSAVDQAMITGESIPRNVTIGDELFAGSLNGNGQLTLVATTTGTDTTVSRIIEMVESAQASKAPSQALVERFAAIYTPIVVGLALVMAIGFSIATGDVATWTYRALVLLVVACPCALVISTPVAIVAAIGRASRRGVLFKGGLALDDLATVRQIAFDKTGTLTHGRPDVVWAKGASGHSDEVIMGLAAALETGSTHPIGRGILRASVGFAVPDVSAVEAVPGRGITGKLGDSQVQLGSRLMFATVPVSVEELLQQADRESATIVLVGRNGIAEGVIALADSIRPISWRVVEELMQIGVEPVMLSGDSAAVANAIGLSAGIGDVRSGLLPGDKVAAIKELALVSPIAMVGDGINDAPALAQATVGIAMGVGGSGAAIEAADVALMGDDLTQIPFAIELARSTRTIVLQNIAFALASKLAFIALTATGYTSLWLAVVADMGASLIVTLNALRLMRDSRSESVRIVHPLELPAS